MDQLCDAGVKGPENGTKPRKILMSMEEFEEYLKNHQFVTSFVTNCNQFVTVPKLPEVQ